MDELIDTVGVQAGKKYNNDGNVSDLENYSKVRRWKNATQYAGKEKADVEFNDLEALSHVYGALEREKQLQKREEQLQNLVSAFAKIKRFGKPGFRDGKLLEAVEEYAEAASVYLGEEIKAGEILNGASAMLGETHSREDMDEEALEEFEKEMSVENFEKLLRR